MTRAASDFRAVHPAPRRGLRRDEAALYVGVSPSKFDEMVRDGLMPKPGRIGGRVIWDVRKLDFAFDALFGNDDPAYDDSWADFDGDSGA